MKRDWNFKMMTQIFGELTPIDVKKVDDKSLLLDIGKLISKSSDHQALLNDISKLLLLSLEMQSIFIFTSRADQGLSLHHYYGYDLIEIDDASKLSGRLLKFFQKRCEEGIDHFDSEEQMENEDVLKLIDRYRLKNFWAIPLYLNEDHEGIMIFNYCEKKYWTHDEGHLLYTIGAIVGQSIHHEIIQKESMQSYNELDTAFHFIGEGMIITDECGKFQTMNQYARDILELKGEMLNLRLEEVGECYTKDGKERILSPIDQILMTEKMWDWGQPFVIRLKSHEKKLLDYCGSPIKDSKNRIIGVILLLYDLSQSIVFNQQLDYLSKYDQVTGLYNRSYFEHLMKDLIRDESMPMAILVGDVNGLKITNDAYGYTYGDDVLRGIGRVLHTVTETKGYSSRWGGDEFVVLLPQSSEEEAVSICSKIKELCHEREHNLNRDSISLGYSVLRDEHFFCGALKEAEDNMNHKKLLESKSLRNHIIKSMQITLQEKSHETESHASRLSSYCYKIGVAMGLSSKLLSDLQLVSVLHDIGKISISKSILEKPGRLTEEEWCEMREHTASGYRILKSIPELAHIAEYVLYHHERFDGSGYPEGLMRDEIPILSRILSVVDAYDAMTHDRSYRKAMSQEKAILELMTHANTQFDSNVVDVFVSILKDEFKNKKFVNL